jgi:integrase
MRTCDIDTTGTIWVYTPVDHKTAHLERERKINIGPKGQAILKPLLRPQLEAFIFSPSESERERREAMHKARKTPPGQGNGPGTNRKRCPKWCPGDKYTTDAYTHAILHACRKAFGDDKSKHWTAHRLRHTFATEVRREFGLESSAVALGHASATVTEAHYAERDEQRAREVALKIG